MASRAGPGRNPRTATGPGVVGPEVDGLHARDTRRVYEELIANARRSVWAVTFAYRDDSAVFDQLASQMKEARGVWREDQPPV